jgi:hypothetical protein
LLEVVDAQHGLDGERRAAGLGLRAVGLNNLHEHRPRHHAVHLLQELALARLLRRQVQAECKLVHGFDAFGNHGLNSCKSRAGFAELP